MVVGLCSSSPRAFSLFELTPSPPPSNESFGDDVRGSEETVVPIKGVLFVGTTYRDSEILVEPLNY